MISESINTPRSYEMTNETAPHENGVADQAAIAALTVADATATTTESIVEAPEEPKLPSFNDFELHPDIRQALDEMGYFTPTAVQTAVYGPVHAGKDLMVQSRTGTGKTTAFGLPILSKLVPMARQPQALILAPTRELALQVARELTNIGKHRGLLVEPIYGGAPIGKQITNLKNGVHVVVGTPGRVLDLIGRGALDTKAINTFVLDECDEMLSMGFLEDIERVVKALPEKKQTLLFSATMPDEVTRYSRRHMVAPEQISLSRDSVSVSDIHHAYYIVSGIARGRDLLKIIYAEEPESAIIFCNMRDETTAVAKYLQKQGLDAEPLSSDLSQDARERVMNRMKAKNLRFLCATDVAARGIDISNLSHVINYSVPESPEVYVHRTGRTGRAGKKGTALSMVGPRELGNFRYVRLTFNLKPEERLLPKDSVFEGKLKVPLPPIGLPQPPDPVQILLRGVPMSATGPSDLEMKIFEKLYATANGKKVLATLVAEKLDKISTRTKPRERPVRVERAEGDAPAAGGEERPRSFDRPDGDRPRSFDGDRGPRRDDRGPRRDGEDRPRRFDRDDRGPRGGGEDRPRRFDRDDRGPRRDHDAPRTDGPRTDGAPPAGVAGLEGTAPQADRGPRPEGDRERRPWRDRDDRGPRRDGEDRPRRFDRDDRGPRNDGPRTDGPRPERAPNGEHGHTDVIVPASASVVETPATVPASTAPDAGTEVRTDRPAGDRERRPWRDRDDRGGRDRGGRDRDRGGRDRDRGGDRDRAAAPAAEPARNETLPLVTEAPPEVAPVVEPITEVIKVDDVARAALERADRGADKKGKKKSEPTAENREFWETWAEEKSTRPEPAAAPVAEAAAEEPAAGGRSRDRGGRGRGARGAEKRGAKADAPAEKTDAKPAKREAAPAAAPASEAGQARLFVSLGKKHGVSADDLRGLLAGPIGGDKARIGSVSLRDSHAHVRVPEDAVDAIIGGVHGTKHNDQDVTVERARA
jgi:ATP-dependent RNA helicase DeaD